MACLIREYQHADAPGLRQCIVALQDFERTIDPRLRRGETMADAYCEQMHARCEKTGGRIFVADQDGSIVGVVAVLAHQPFTELDDPPGTYALVTDLVVQSPFRQQGIGRRLLERAEAFAKAAGARELRIGVLARNEAARRLYLVSQFVPHLEIFSKRW